MRNVRMPGTSELLAALRIEHDTCGHFLYSLAVADRTMKPVREH